MQKSQCKRVSRQGEIDVALIHSRTAISAVLFALALGVWALWSFLRGRGVGSSYWGALIIGELLMLAQGFLGILLVFGGARPADWLHVLYGVLVALSWPGVYVYTRARGDRREAGLYALVSFFVFGLALRAITTG
jgi:hypothetical protein